MSLKVNRDDANVTNDGKLLQMRAAATGQARSPIVLWRVTRTSTAVNELECTRRIPTYVITIHQRHRQTDRRQKTALWTIVHRAVKTGIITQ